jgi:putative membrane protein
MAASVVAANQAPAGGQEKPKPAPEQAKAGQKTPAGADAAFMRQAAADSTAEVEHGRLAAQNGQSNDVKQFGQRMVDDHSKANDELKGLASQKQVTLPTELEGKHRAMQDRLMKLKGAAFDKAYMAHMVTAHQQAVSLFQRESKAGKDADAKAWAAKTLPTLQEHLKMARDINGKLGKS